MPFIKKPIELQWTLHARAKMRHYRLTPSRVRHVMHSPKRIEEGVAPRTVAMMQPASLKTAGGRAGMGKKETWTQEIWTMVQDTKDGKRKVISAWRYPGVTKPRGSFIEKEYKEFLTSDLA